jgi:hypothetical protein
MLVPFGIQTRTIPDSADSAVSQIIKYCSNIDLLIAATPSLDWVSKHKNTLVSLMCENGILFLGTSSPSGQPFELHPYTVEQFLKFNISPRRAA